MRLNHGNSSRFHQKIISGSCWPGLSPPSYMSRYRIFGTFPVRLKGKKRPPSEGRSEICSLASVWRQIMEQLSRTPSEVQILVQIRSSRDPTISYFGSGMWHDGVTSTNPWKHLRSIQEGGMIMSNWVFNGSGAIYMKHRFTLLVLIMWLSIGFWDRFQCRRSNPLSRNM